MTLPTQERLVTLVPAAFLMLQSVAAIFFVGDVLADMQAEPFGAHSLVEVVVTLALICGIALSAWHLRQTLERMRAQDRALATARGELARTIERQFDSWGLTPAERDVGFLALKGLDVSEIAALRGAAQGTVRAQLTRIYAKAGVSGRAQFGAWFVEDLLDEGLRAAE
ncbi:helix-turn-helix transcriptional regulator [Marinibacterium profundimaris]|uniref:LuxR family transcriptional regulator n=1 Tax=Marinibacterium profundimaris TaxID=1679460 RepID=A0A225NSI8_9RHOB|nr:helix-turn-helix transcriptional regulator [Marinibacterium profundimaris]OWU75997.1 LuxR family transcriptional regulator [Marinibacterium profundimaris]